MSQFVANNVSTSWNNSSNQLQTLGQSVLSQPGNVSLNNSTTNATIPAQLYSLHQQQQQQLTPGLSVGTMGLANTTHTGVGATPVVTGVSSVTGVGDLAGGASLMGVPPVAAQQYQQQQQQQLFQPQQTLQPTQQQQQQSTIAVGVSPGGGGGGLVTPSTIQHVTPAEMAAAASLISALGKHVTQNTPQTKHRVFTGAISMLQDTFGFVDNDVFFKTSCVKGGVPRLGDRVLVDCHYNANMPFNWNADRVQILPSGNTGNKRNHNVANSPSVLGSAAKKSGGLVAGGAKTVAARSSVPARAAVKADARLPHSGRPRSPVRRPAHEPRSRNREEESRDSSSPRRRSRPAPRYSIHLPRHILSLRQANVVELGERYSNLYIPSDFVQARFFHDTIFPLHQPFKVTTEVSYHILDKDSGVPEPSRSVFEPEDVNYSYSAKVMLLSSPSWSTLCQQAIPQLLENSAESDNDPGGSGSGSVPQHPARGIGFLVGLRGKNETMAVGGAWSPSLDGPDPANNPHVLIRTATRTCHALTGVDLSRCTKWWRLAEIVYRRSERSTEIVVLFMPDTRALMPSCVDWQTSSSTGGVGAISAPLVDADTTTDADDSSVLCESEDSEMPESDADASVDPRNMKVSELRQELESRNLSSKGLKTQLIARLVKVLKSERSDAANTSTADTSLVYIDKTGGGVQKEETSTADGPKSPVESKAPAEPKPADDKSTGSDPTIKLPDKPCVLVYPCRSAKSGKFDCAVISLSVLLDYRHDDKKEHSFEVSLFAEIFNEMLLRDAAFNIFHSLYDMKEREKGDRDTTKSSKDSQKSEKEAAGSNKLSSGSDTPKSSKANDTVATTVKTSDTEFLMSFAYFDTGHCEYVTVRDLEQIIMLAGLQLSRSQCRRFVQRVCGEKDTSVYYGKLGAIDRRTPALQIVSKHGPVMDATSAANNQDKGDDSAKSGVVEYQGSLVDIASLMERLSKIDDCLQKTEQRLTQTLKDNESLRQQCSASEKSADRQRSLLSSAEQRAATLQQQLNDTSGTLRDYRKAVDTVMAACTPLSSSVQKQQQEKNKRTDKAGSVGGSDEDDVQKKSSVKAEDKDDEVHDPTEKTAKADSASKDDSPPAAKRTKRG